MGTIFNKVFEVAKFMQGKVDSLGSFADMVVPVKRSIDINA